MQFIDIARQYNRIRSRINQRVHDVLEHGRFIMGPEVRELEARLADFIGVRYCVTCSSGTDALLMPLMAWNIGPGDAVFTTPFTFIATAEVVSLLGATPVFVDIDSQTYNIHPSALEEAIQRIKQQGKLRPRAIITVDLFGLPADYDRIIPLAEENDLLVLEDSAQSFGGTINNRRACSFGHAAATSFFPAKPLGCYGDGGAIFTNDGDLAAELESIRVHGKGKDKYDNVRVGLNGRLDTLQAAILLEKLAIFEEELSRRDKVARAYSVRLKDQLVVPTVPDGYTSAWAQYSVLAASDSGREALIGRLKHAGIPTAIYYPKPLHLQTAYRHLGYKSDDFPVSEDVSRRIFSLPMHPYLEPEEIDCICEKLLLN